MICCVHNDCTQILLAEYVCMCVCPLLLVWSEWNSRNNVILKTIRGQEGETHAILCPIMMMMNPRGLAGKSFNKLL